jgi:hypothetical protein
MRGVKIHPQEAHCVSKCRKLQSLGLFLRLKLLRSQCSLTAQPCVAVSLADYRLPRALVSSYHLCIYRERRGDLKMNAFIVGV